MFGNRQFLELGPKLGSIGSNLWEPAVPRVQRLGSMGSNVWNHQFLELGTSVRAALVPTFGNREFLGLGTRGAKIGKHRFQCFGTVSS